MAKQDIKRRFLKHSPDALTDVELLELLLRFAGEGAKERAELLLERYGNIGALMELDTRELSALEGMNEESVLLLRLVPELHRRYFFCRAGMETRLTDSAAIGQYLLPFFYGAKDELVYLLCLDAAGRVLACRLIERGSVNSANVPARRLVQEALSVNATTVVLAHNHPSDIALPSREDVDLTLRLREALDILDIHLLDHIVVADDDYVSMRESGYLRRY